MARVRKAASPAMTSAVEMNGTRSRRDRILSGAAKLFAAKGFSATSMNDIAAGAEIAKPTLFHYFPSKLDILFELYRQTMDLALDRMRAVVGSHDEPVTRVRAWVREHALLILENRELFKIFFDEEGELSPEQRGIIRAQQRDYIKLIADEVRAMRELGLAPKDLSPNVAVQSLIGMASWVYKWYEVDGPVTPTEVADIFAEIAANGVLRLD